MEEKNITLIIGLAGIASTLIAGGLGSYFTARARSSPLRETLFSKQLELMTKVIKELGTIRIFLTILAGEKNEYVEQAIDDIRESVKRFSEMQEEGAALLPTELWIEVKKVNDYIVNILVSYDDKNEIVKESLKSFVAMCTKIGLMSRNVFGVDELTEESLKLFSSKKHYEELANLEIEHIKKFHERFNA